MPLSNLGVSHEQIVQFCQCHHIRRLMLFGSVLREDFGPDSDVDVLVEFELNQTPGLAFFAMQDELSSLFGHKVDLSTPRCLSHYFRNAVLQEAQVLYAAS